MSCALSLRHVSKSYRGHHGAVPALRDVSLDVDEGAIVALLGQNGAGKTSLIKSALGLVAPDAGTVRLFGCDPARDPGVLQLIGAVVDSSRGFYGRLTVAENIEYFAALKGCRPCGKRRKHLMEAFDIAHKAGEQAQSLSRGMAQRLSVVCALMHAPRLLLLDEPTLGLDKASTEQLTRALRNESDHGMTVVVSSHNFDWVESLAHAVALMREGRIARYGHTSALIDDYQLDGYKIELIADAPPGLEDRLRGVCHFVGSKSISVVGDSLSLYRVLDAIRPLAIRSVDKLDSTLGGAVDRALHHA